MNPFTLPRMFRKSKTSRDTYLGSQTSTEPTESKVHYLLGITDTELKTVRSRSISSGSTARLYSVSFSEATTPPASSHRSAVDAKPIHALPKSDTKSNSLFSKDNRDRNAITPELQTRASSTTLSSHYDSKIAPMSVSQQTSDSSSRDFALRKELPPVLNRSSQEMEHVRQMRFFKSSKSRAKEGKNQARPGSNSGDNTPRASPVPTNQSLPIWPTKVEGCSPISPHPTTPIRRFFSQKTQTSNHPTQSPPRIVVDTTPYTKINVRRPRVGAKHWFDDLGGESSDEENHKVLALEQKTVDKEQATHGENDKSDQVSTIDGERTPCPQSIIHHIRKPLVAYRVVSAPGTAPVELPAYQSPQKATANLQKSQPRRLSTRLSANPLAKIDLTKQSVLSLSSSDDDEDDAFVESTKPKPIIRDSITVSTMRDSEIEVGVARAVGKSIPRQIAPTVLPQNNEAVKSIYSSFPAPLRSRASSRASQYTDQTSEKDVSESDIITAFPATPSEGTSRRTSIQTLGTLSDSASVKSTRMMQVTRQEQSLLAAMRSKKAAMREAGKTVDRHVALKVLESGSGRPLAPSLQAGPSFQEQSRPDPRMSNRYAPPRVPAHRRSFSGSDANANARGSGTTFQTSLDGDSWRGSRATFMTTFSDEQQLSHPAHKVAGPDEVPPAFLRPRYSSLASRNPARDTFLSINSIASDSSGPRRNSNIVMLDDLDGNPERGSIPSQLFLETPFVGWDRFGPATAAH